MVYPALTSMSPPAVRFTEAPVMLKVQSHVCGVPVVSDPEVRILTTLPAVAESTTRSPLLLI
jgi:hypothetical protein